MTAAPDYQCRSFATASCSLCSRSSPFYPPYHLNVKVNDKSAQSEGSLTCSSKNIVLPGTPGHCLDGRLVSCDRVHRRLPGLNSDNNAQWQIDGQLAEFPVSALSSHQPASPRVEHNCHCLRLLTFDRPWTRLKVRENKRLRRLNNVREKNEGLRRQNSARETEGLRRQKTSDFIPSPQTS